MIDTFTSRPRTPYYDGRMLWICIGGSVLLHALVMWQVRGVKPGEMPVTQIRATIKPFVPPAPPAIRPAAVAPEPPKPEPPKEAPPPEPPRPVAKPAAPEARPLPKAADAKAAPTTAPPPQAAPPAPAASGPPELKTAPSVEQARPAAAPAASGAPESADEKALVYGYQVALAQGAQKYKRYPAEAMQQGWEGRALVRLRVGVDGKTAGIEVISSSGHEMLDEQAKIAINKAKPLAQVPPGLVGKAFNADVMVIFDLKK